MTTVLGRRFWTLLGAAGLLLTGCAEMPTWIPFAGPTSDTLPGLVTPAEKIKQLKKLAWEASKSDAERKQLVVKRLTHSIRNEADPLVRTEIIRTAGEYRIAESAPLLKVALSDPDAEVRQAACEAWGKRGDAQAADLLAGTLRCDSNREVRLAAARALASTPDPLAIAALGEALTESDPAMQYRAVLSLKRITGEDLGNNVDRWRQYVQEGRARPAESISVAERLKRLY